MSRDFKTEPTFEGKKVLHEKLFDAKGDLIVASAADTHVVLSAGSNGAILVADNGQVAGVKWDLPSDFLPFNAPGVLSVRSGATQFPFPLNATLLGVTARVSTAPTGSSIIVDVNKNGTTLFTTQGNRPTIAASAFSSGEATPNITSISAGDYLTVDIDQVGSTVAGSELVVVVRYRRT